MVIDYIIVNQIIQKRIQKFRIGTRVNSGYLPLMEMEKKNEEEKNTILEEEEEQENVKRIIN